MIRGLFACCVLSALILIVSVAQLAPLMTDGQQIVRIRNSLIFEDGGSFDWSPQESPQWYKQEASAPTPFFKSVAASLAPVSHDHDAFDVALQIARFLHPHGRAKGGMIASDTEQTYKRIMTTGEGYCADYTQVFTALSHTLGVPVREWGISFEKYSGDGHAFNEVYSERYSKWVFIDAFNGFYITSEVGTPLSYSEFKRALLASADQTLQVNRIENDIFAFRSDEMAIDYIRRGVPRSFLWAANDVFAYESNPVIQFTSDISRSIEQASAILIGVHPKIMLDMDGVDSASLKELGQIRLAVFAAAISGFLLFVFTILSFCAWRRARKPH